MIGSFAVIAVMGLAVFAVYATLTRGRIVTRRGPRRGSGCLARLVPWRFLRSALPSIPFGVAYATVVMVIIRPVDPTLWIVIAFLSGWVFAMADILGSMALAIGGFVAACIAVWLEMHEMAEARGWMLFAMLVVFLAVLVFFLVPPLTAGDGIIAGFAAADIVGYLFVTGRISTLVTTTDGRGWMVLILGSVAGALGFGLRLLRFMGSSRSPYSPFNAALTALGIGLLVLSFQAVWLSDATDALWRWGLTVCWAFLFAGPYGWVRRAG